MGNRVGLARTQALIENLKRELTMGGTKLGGLKESTKSVTSDTTLAPADSGKVILMGQNGVDITLPTATAGMTFTIIQVEDYVTAVCTVVAVGVNFMAGAVGGVAVDSNQLANGSSNVTATWGSGTLAGDQITLVSDGTLWYVTGTCAAGGANGIAFS